MAFSHPPLIWLYNLAGARIVPLHDVTDLVTEDRLGDLQVLRFTVRADDPKARFVIADTLVEYAGVIYRLDDILQLRRGSVPVLEVYAEARWMDLGKRVRTGNFSVLAKTVQQGIDQILTGTGWTGTGPALDPALYSIEDIDPTVLSLVRRWAAITGYEIIFDTVARTIDLVDAVGQDRQIGFRWGHNLLNIERRYRPPTATRLYPYGANNLSIDSVNPSGELFVEDFSWYTAQGLTLTQARALFRKDQTWVDQRYLLAVNLYDAAIRRLAALAQPILSYELAVIDLAELTGTDVDDIDIGDTVRVRDRDLDIDVPTRVVRIVRHPNRPQDNEIELDYLQPGILQVEPADFSRSIDYSQASILVDQNIDAFTVTGGVSTWAAIAITVAGESTFVAGGTFAGTPTGSGIAIFGLYVDGTPVGDEYTVPFDAATHNQVEFSWPTMSSGIAEGSYNVEWRARILSGAGTIDVNAEAAKGWLLARGAVGIGVNLNPSQTINEVIDVLDPATWLPVSDEWTVAITDLTGPPDDILIELDDTITEVDPLLYLPLSEAWTEDRTPLLTFVDATAENYGAGDSITTIDVVVPAGSVENNLIAVVLMQQAGSSDVTAPAGFTRIAQQNTVSGNQWTEIWTATDDGTMAGTTLTFTTTVAGRLGIICLVIDDSDAVGAVVEQTAGTSYNTAAGIEPFPTVTSGGLGRVVVAVSTCEEAGTGTTTFSTPTGYTILTRPSAGDTPTHERNRMMVAYRLTDAATFAGLTTTHSGGAHDAATLHVVFEPA